MDCQASFDSKLTALKRYWTDLVIAELWKGKKTEFETAIQEIAKEELSEVLITLWMTVFKTSVIEGLLPEAENLQLTNWLFTRVPWFDTKTQHFHLFKQLESYAFASIAKNHSLLQSYIDFLARNLVPHDLSFGIDQLLASQQIEIAGKVFHNQGELISFVEKEIIGNLNYDDGPAEINNELHKEILMTIFKHSNENFAQTNIQKITFGPHSISGGAFETFQVSRLVPLEPSEEDCHKQTKDASGKLFAVPSRRELRTEMVSYIDSIKKLFTDLVFCREQGYIQSVNGVFFPSYFAAIEGLVRRYPLRQHDILDSLIKHFPHHRSENLVLVCSARNLLSLAVAMPAFENQVINFIVTLLIKLDCEVRSGRNKEKIDAIMELLILYINYKLEVEAHASKEIQKQMAEVCALEGITIVAQKIGGRKKQTPKDKENFIQLLLRTFSEKIVKIEKPNIVHFAYYYISSLAGEYDWIKEAFLEQLILNIHNKSLQKQIKLHSLYYLFSFVRASNFLNGLILHTALSYLIDFLVSNYSKYIKRHPQLHLKPMTSDEIKKGHVRRIDSTENTSPIRDDIFIFCYQSCLDLFVTKRQMLNELQLTDLVAKFDHLTEKTSSFICYSVTESETFFQLFKSLRSNIEDSFTKTHLDEMLVFNSSSRGEGKFVSPKAKQILSHSSKKIVLKDIDYLPFRPLRMRFYKIFISPYILPSYFSDSLGDHLGSPFDSSLSMVETSATEQHAVKVTSPLGKRQSFPDQYLTESAPNKKYST